MKRETNFLQIAILIIGLLIFVLSVVGIGWLVNNPANPEYVFILYPIIIGLYLSVISFYIALYKAFKLLSYIKNSSTTNKNSLVALKTMKYCTISISLLYVAIMPFIYLLADKDDAPGLIIIGLLPIFVSMVISVLIALLQKLLNSIVVTKVNSEIAN